MTDSYQNDLFKKVSEHHSWKQELACFTRLWGDAYWCIISLRSNPQFPFLHNPSLTSSLLRHYRQTLNTVLGQAAVQPVPQCAQARNQRYVYVLPLKRGDQVYGYAGLYHVAHNIPTPQLELFEAFTCTVLENIQKQMELNKLTETMRPKIIALSTVHTIGRILSATLDINELLPRIARLTLQVLRARRCIIMLMDKSQRTLLPRAVVDLKNKHYHQPPLKLGCGIPGKVARSGKMILQPHCICVALISEENVIGTIMLTHRLDNKPFDAFDKEILTTLSEQAVSAIRNARLYEEQENLTLNSIKALAAILSSGAVYTFGRTNLFINITMSIGTELKLTSDQMRILYYASILHNVSQMGLPEKILKKATRLTGREQKIIREHPLIGAQIIQPIGGRLKAVLPIIIYHHERYDGTGYPSGQKGDQIPLGARILAVADSFEAMLSQRPYRKKMTLPQTVSEIVRLSGEQFDPVVVDAFVRVIKRYRNKILRPEKQNSTWVWKKF